MIHFSIDDCIDIFEDLHFNNYDSIFDNTVLNYFKILNSKYNFKVSLYCFFEKEGFNLSMCSGKYRKEFEENSDWLKFGFHSLNQYSNYAECETVKFRNDLIKTVNSLKNIVSESALTFNVRLGFAQGNIDCIKEMKSLFGKFTVLYGVDDDRLVYYLDKEKNKQYLNDGFYNDENIGITIKNCELRMEQQADFDNYIKNIKSDKIYSFFTHEIYLKNDDILNCINKLCKTGHSFIL